MESSDTRHSSIELDHTIVPSRDRRAAAELISRILDVPWSESGVGPFCPVYINDHLTLDIDQCEEEAFDALVGRLRAIGIGYRSMPHGPVDMKINTQHGGHIVYWSLPDGHVWEALTVSYARETRRTP